MPSGPRPRLNVVRRKVRRRAGRLARRLGVLPTPPPVIVRGGLVEKFKTDRVMGWVDVVDGAPPIEVKLFLNKIEIARTWATEPIDRPSDGEVRPYRFWLKDIWRFARTTDRLVVQVDGTALPIQGHGMFFRPAENGRSSPTRLKQRLADGYVFGQKGSLQLSKSLDVAWQQAVMSTFAEARAFLKSARGYDAFFMYGTLLGAIRENGFIGHDLDLDIGYISSHRDGLRVAAELRDLGLEMIDAGYTIGCFMTHLHIVDAANTRIDIFPAYFDADDMLAIPFGIAGTTTITRDEWQGVTEIDFPGGTGVVPVIGERLVEHLYGASWRRPKPGFMWWLDRTTRATDGIMPDEMSEEIYWSNFYAHNEFVQGSPFAETVNSRSDLPDHIIDIGCGDGRDTIVFGLSGRTTLGIDRSQVGVRNAEARSHALGLADRVRFETCDFSLIEPARAAFMRAIAQAGEQPVLFYLRFVLHSVPADIQDMLLDLIDECARPGDLLAAEFRTVDDEQLAKTYSRRFRRFLDGPDVGRLLADRYRFAVLDECGGTGLSPYQGEDPELYRVIAQRVGS